MRHFRGIYIIAVVFLGVVFFSLMGAPMLGSTMELDLGRMFPALSALVEAKSGWGITAFVLTPTPPALEPPVVKAFLFLATPIVGLQLKHLVLISLIVHCATAILLYRVVRQFRIGIRSSFFTACFYFTVSAHFHAFLWPVVLEHFFAAFTILLLLHLYLKTEAKMWQDNSGLPWA